MRTLERLADVAALVAWLATIALLWSVHDYLLDGVRLAVEMMGF